MNFTASGLDWQSNAIENKTNYEFSLKETAKRNAYHEAWFLYENDFFQYEQGLVSEEVWQAKLSAFSHWYNMCDMRNLYEIRSKWMPAAFRELIESFPDECRKS